jgi:hypothetical protein
MENGQQVASCSNFATILTQQFSVNVLHYPYVCIHRVFFPIETWLNNRA